MAYNLPLKSQLQISNYPMYGYQFYKLAKNVIRTKNRTTLNPTASISLQ